VSQWYEVLDTISTPEGFDIVLGFDENWVVRVTKLRNKVPKDEVVLSSLSHIPEQDHKMPTVGLQRIEQAFTGPRETFDEIHVFANITQVSRIIRVPDDVPVRGMKEDKIES
jgi:hypothetical protein